jgi:hypothetical protein
MKLTVTCVYFLLGLITTLHVCGQDNTIRNLSQDAMKGVAIKDTSHKIWRTGGIFSVNLSQSALSHWAAGGDKSSFSLTSLLNGYASYNKGKNSWDNLLDAAYGYINTSSTGFRKNDDHFNFTSKYGRQASANKKWYYALLFDFKSQFAIGYLYNDTGRTYNSTFFSPAYILLSLGMDYKPSSYFDLFLSPLTSRWTIVQSDFLSAKGMYGVDSGRHVRNEIGAFLAANFNKNFTKAVNYTAQLQLFSNYKHDPQNIDVYWTNLLTLAITRYLATTIAVNMIYDDDVKFPTGDGQRQAPFLQLQEMLGVGFSYKF